MKKALIINKNQFIGTGIHKNLSSTYVIGGTSRSGEGKNTIAIDLTDKYAVNNLFTDQSFDIVVYTPQTRQQEECCKNGEGIIDKEIARTNNVIDAIQGQNIKFIFISSREVYGGDNPPYRTDSERVPVSHCGKAFLESEYAIQKNLVDYCIIRPGKVYGFTEDHGFDNFTQRVLDSSLSNKGNFDNNRVEYPTLVDDLIDLVRKIIDHDLTNNYNISSRLGVTNYEWAKIICEVHDLNQNMIEVSQLSNKDNYPHDVRYNLDSITDLGLSVKSVKEGTKIAKIKNFCTFRPIYIQDIGDYFGDKSSSVIRHQLGTILAERDEIDGDVVVPIPESGVYPANGYASSSNVPLEFALSKQNLRHRTLYDSGVDRGKTIQNHMKVIPEIIADKKVILVDEALLSGTTVQSVLPKLDSASEVHLRFSSPPVVRSCPAGVYPNDTDLIAKRTMQLEDADLRTIENNLTDELDVNSVNFVPTKEYSSIINKPCGNCTACFH